MRAADLESYTSARRATIADDTSEANGTLAMKGATGPLGES